MGDRGLVTGGRRHESSDLLAPFLRWPFRELLVFSCRKGKGPELGGRRGRKGGTLWSGSCSQHSCAVPAERQILSSRPLSPCPGWSRQCSCSHSFWLNKQRPWQSLSSAISWMPSCFSTALSSPCSTADSSCRCERQLPPVRNQMAFTRA